MTNTKHIALTRFRFLAWLLCEERQPATVNDMTLQGLSQRLDAAIAEFKETGEMHALDRLAAEMHAEVAKLASAPTEPAPAILPIDNS